MKDCKGDKDRKSRKEILYWFGCLRLVPKNLVEIFITRVFFVQPFTTE